LALTASEDCVRALKPGSPARTARQLAQLQFHCGKPPPAPEPKILIRIFCASSARAYSPTRRVPLFLLFSVHYVGARRALQLWRIHAGGATLASSCRAKAL
jgi:hypothetical protein